MSDQAHTTEQEMKFLDDLGFHTDKPFKRRKLLESYIKAAEKRSDWCGMDGDEVVAYARGLLVG